jgi:prevent-host-death family protein
VKKATITETKNKLSALIDRVRHGETVLILDRGRPVARLESVLAGEEPGEGRLERLERMGVLRRATGPVPAEILDQEPPRPTQGSVLEELLEERRTGR